MAYVIHEQASDSRVGMSLRGAVRELWRCKDQEVMVGGPAETGKTIGCLLKVNALAWKYPNSVGAIARKTYNSMSLTVLPSFEKKILANTYGKVVKAYGGEKPEWYQYPNGSRIWVVGMDNPGKVLSAELDFAYVNQAEEFDVNQWEYLLTRTTGRAGNMPYAQLFGDCNPGPSNHWIRQRFGSKLLESRHEDNPTLFDSDGKITDQGKRSLAALDALTGVRYQRLRLGKWVSAEGSIYEQFDRAIHVIKRKDVPKCDRSIEVVDFGYTNPFCWQRWDIDNDGRAYVVLEIYKTQTLVEDLGKQVKELTKGMRRPEAIVCDHDAEDRRTFEKHRGMLTIGADKAVTPGIEDVQKRLRRAGDGKPRFFVCEDGLVEVDMSLKGRFLPTCALDEVEGYVWTDPTKKQDTPVKEWDHGMDTWRYGCRYLERMIVPTRRSTSTGFGSM